MSRILEQWDEILQVFKTEYDISNVAFSTWIKPLEVYEVNGNVITIIVRDQLTLQHIEKKYKFYLQVTINEVAGIDDCEIKFIIPENVPSKKEIPTPKLKTQSDRCKEARLNPRYTFDTFVVGSNNEFTHRAALSVAEAPGESFNPLFIYGGAGLGKTHLMHSIAHHVIENNKDSKVIYVTSEEFTIEVIENIRHGEAAMKKFRDKYRNVDVLLIDDIQFIIGKDSTQMEFFHTFNTLHSAGKQIVISSDKPPKDMEILEERIKTRFSWGLTTEIRNPDFETRMAILHKKEELDGCSIDNKVIEYIAENVKSSIRELEGALTKVIALSKLEQKEISIDLAAEALKDIISPNNKKVITHESIISIVSDHFSVTPADLAGNKRSKNIVVPRQIAMYLCRELLDTSLKEIGKSLGDRDHTTIMHGIEKVEAELQTNKDIEKQIDILKKKINPQT